MKLTCIKLCLAMLFVVAAGQLQAQATSPADDEATSEEGIFALGWLAQTHAYSSNRANALADQLDRFFGVPRSDLEAAYSSLRLIPELRWQDNGVFKSKLSVRGRIHLPRLNKRISLIFSEDKGEGTDYYAQNRLFEEPQSTKVNLGINLTNTRKHRLDFRIGLRSNIKLRTSIRYRYEAPLNSKLSNRLSETLYYIDGSGAGSLTQYQLDYQLNEKRLLRWSSQFRHESYQDGDQWSSELAHMSHFNETGASSVFVRMTANTKESYIDNYQAGFRLRSNFTYPWLFWEFSPGYQWEKLSEQAPREGGLFAVFRLEMAIGRQ